MNSASDSNDFVEQSNAQKVFNVNQRSAAYSVGPIQGHVHNGVDSNKIQYKDILGTPTSTGAVIYSGQIAADGTASSFFPSEWTSTRTSDPGQYKITHNLGHTNYSFVAFNANGAGDTAVIAGTLNANTVTYSGDVPASGFQNTAISFILTTQANP